MAVGRTHGMRPAGRGGWRRIVGCNAPNWILRQAARKRYVPSFTPMAIGRFVRKFAGTVEIVVYIVYNVRCLFYQDVTFLQISAFCGDAQRWAYACRSDC